ncbi:putative polypeptide N-acetylgalactosaminyltransferase 11 [Drosophila ficusphila]|uniref:putative polypeptide N-acetylgalactosaminyltransferase 11 n=1 Tax=Drosophila ficusphila TaxID=30025 RepID=UPI0007E691DF|nr:putative polypeptide N-acetylgalactosaminyltransferase 11 [Drosophila ficusphila]
MKRLILGSPCPCTIFLLIHCTISLCIWFLYTENLSGATVDFEYFAIDNLGQYGKEAYLQITRNDIVDIESKYSIYHYNAWISERIPLQRTLKDYRAPECRNIIYTSEGNITVSIIIAHQMEHPHTLLRTIYSIIAQTSSDLLNEIILVHDGVADWDLSWYISQKLSMVTQLEIESPIGIIHARLRGAKIATGDVLVFLNSHMEVTKGWLPPLLEPILWDKKRVTQPIMDTISGDSFAYHKLEEPEQMAFDWQLERIWIPLDKITRHTLPKPFPSSQLDGRVFAIHRKWFWRLGGWDEGLKDYGGDALELSLKTWQCGGHILTVPCSRVGIIYNRDEIEAQMAPNKNLKLQVKKNFKRVVDVWFDEFKINFYLNNPRLSNLSTESLKEQRERRYKLKCKSFGWYRSQVAPHYRNHYLNAETINYAVGKITSFQAPDYCLTIKAGFPNMRRCNSSKFEDWTWTSRCQLKLGPMCLGVDPKNNIIVSKCTKKIPDIPWHYNYQQRSFVTQGNKCLQINMSTGLILRPCDSDKVEQRWMYTGIKDFKLDQALNICLNIKK